MDEFSDPKFRRIDRRQALSRIGAAGALAMLPFDISRAAAQPALSCVATPTQTEGPYFVDERLSRADIRSDPATGALKEGVPLKLRLVANAVAGGACTPLAGRTRLRIHVAALFRRSDLG